MESSVKIVTISVNSFDINSHLDSITLTSNKTYIDFDSDNNDSILITLNGGVLGLENLNIQPLALPNEFSNILQLNLIDESNNILNYELSFKSTASSLA
jgi:hypothetical protein